MDDNPKVVIFLLSKPFLAFLASSKHTMGSNQLWRSILQFYVCTFTFPTRVFTRFSWYIHGIVLKLKTYLVKTQKNKQEYFFFRIDLNLLWHCTIKPIQYRVFNFILYGIWRNISQTRHLSKTGNVENMSSNHIWTNNETVSLTGSDPTMSCNNSYSFLFA